jgi:transcriptional regulator GlxA family with amidase domain
MLDVTIVLLDNNYASTALGPIEVFHSAGRLWNVLRGDEPRASFRVTVASMNGDCVTSPYGVCLSPQVSIREVQTADIIVVPASGLDLDDQFARHRDLMPWLSSWHSKGTYVASICSGAAYLAEAGLLDGREATTHWAVADAYQKRYPNVHWRPKSFITEDQRVLCSGGVYASIDLSLYLVEKFCGHEIALQCAKALLVNMPRRHQSGYAVLPLSQPHSDKKIRAVEGYIDEHFARDLTIETLAGRVNMTPRTFMRRFKSATGRKPGEYMQTLRITIAREMLENDDLSVEAVSRAIGYDDSAFFRTLFKRHTGMTPGEYRTNFAGSVSRQSR